MNSYVTTPHTSNTRSRHASTGYVTSPAKPAVVGGYVSDVALSAVVGSYVDCDVRSNTSYELAS